MPNNKKSIQKANCNDWPFLYFFYGENKLENDYKIFAKEMESISDSNFEDVEARHILMDELLCKKLIELGYIEGVKIFEDAKKWYA